MLIFDKGSFGTIAGVEFHDAGDCCVRVDGDACWRFKGCKLVCGHAAALRIETQATALLGVVARKRAGLPGMPLKRFPSSRRR